MKRALAILMALTFILAIACSCDSGKGDGGKATASNAIQTNGDYELHDIDMQGEEIVVLNPETFAGMRIYFEIDKEETDSVLNEALYESNLRAQEQFNFVLKEDPFPYSTWETMYIDMANHFIKNVNAGDDVYDFIHFPINQRVELMTNGYIMDLSDLDGFHLDQPWWDQRINENININGRQYMVAGSINMMPYETMAAVFFNKTIFANNGMEDPYELVREGKWTLDKMIELARQGMTMNTDPNWWVIDGGTSIFGFGRHRDFPENFFIGAGINFVTEKDGDYELTMESDDFYLTLEKVQTLYSGCERGGVGSGDASNTSYNFFRLFYEGRMVFIMNGIDGAYGLRSHDIDFGILPTPKLREEQEDYITNVNDRLHFICIPSTSEHPEEVAMILDALAYDRYHNVVDVYYDYHMTYKGMRDEDSCEMLDILARTRTMDVGIAYGWCSELVTEMNWDITNKGIASMIASKKGAINTNIDDFVDNYLN